MWKTSSWDCSQFPTSNLSFKLTCCLHGTYIVAEKLHMNE